MQRHHHETVHVVLAGDGHSEIEDATVRWTTGSLVYTPPWTWHRHYNDSAEHPVEFLTIENSRLLGLLGVNRRQSAGLVDMADRPRPLRRGPLMTVHRIWGELVRRRPRAAARRRRRRPHPGAAGRRRARTSSCCTGPAVTSRRTPATSPGSPGLPGHGLRHGRARVVRPARQAVHDRRARPTTWWDCWTRSGSARRTCPGSRSAAGSRRGRRRTTRPGRPARAEHARATSRTSPRSWPGSRSPRRAPSRTRARPTSGARVEWLFHDKSHGHRRAGDPAPRRLRPARLRPRDRQHPGAAGPGGPRAVRLGPVVGGRRSTPRRCCCGPTTTRPAVSTRRRCCWTGSRTRGCR